MRAPSSPHSTWVYHPRAIIFLVLLSAIPAFLWFTVCAASSKAAPLPRHGLTGFYYVSDLPLSRDFQLPEPLREADGTRVDANIAFGQGQGFTQTAYEHMGDWANLPALGHPNRGLGWLKGVVWRGFIHLPRAGTYYFATVSHGSSAIYLNQARVALNGTASVYGALINSDAFSYDPADIKDYTENVRGTPFFKRIEDAYSFPVTVTAPRDLPIEVRYGASSVGVFGIDLFWTTPDSPKDASGKPVLKIVPSEALYTEAPAPAEPVAVRSANSTISADLYCAGVNARTPLTLSFRLADRNGQPVAGKQVIFTTLADDKFGFDDLVQPTRPTDEQGITTAQLKSKPDSRAHVSSIFALDITDLVEIGQVGHVRFPGEITGFFASPCTEGFDPHLVSIEPQPMMVGHPLTIKVKLENRENTDVDLDATFQATYWNIGANTWKDIGQVSNIHLKPAEIKDVSVVWTPTAEQIHQCFRVKLKRNQRAGIHPGSSAIATVIPPVGELLPAALLVPGDEANGGTTQRNMTAVAAPPNPCQHYFNGDYPPEDYSWYPKGNQLSSAVFGDNEYWDQIARSARAAAIASPPDSRMKKDINELADCFQWLAANSGWSDPIPESKANARRLANQNRTDQSTDQRIASKCSPGDADCTATWAANAAADAANAKQYDSLADDPPAAIYRGLAVSQADSSPAYIEAIRVSMERYQGAQSNGDSEWMARHLTAILLYEKRLTAALLAQADSLKKKAGALTAQDSKTAFLHAAEVKQAEATSWQKLAESLQGQVPHGQASSPRIQTSDLSNPHDRTEDVRLTIQPMSIPSDWRLSVINAEEVDALDLPGSAPKPGKNQPQFPIHEVTPGKDYVVSLPPGQTIKVASVLVPVGEIGANTTARWAVEGRIGNQVIGTMVHEMQAAYVIPDLKLPAIGSKEQLEEGLPASAPSIQSPILLYVLIAGAVALLVIVVFLARRRRKETAA